VTAYTIAIARKWDCPRAALTWIARGSFLHDIGKMAIPDHILRSPASSPTRKWTS